MQISETAAPPVIAICVVTFRRPDGLARLIRALDRLRFTQISPKLHLYIVDNDEQESAGMICRQLSHEVAIPLAYHVESRRGIPFARNRAVSLALPASDFIVFIDDDELPEADWLEKLLLAQRTCNADIVTGPVIPSFPAQLPDWMVEGRFFELIRYPTGQTINRAYTNNTLVRAEVFREFPTPFDERMAMTGGSDTHFFRRAHRAGHRIVWADDAIVHDCFPATRLTTGWILQRAFRIGNSDAFIECDLNPTTLGFLKVAVLAGYRILKGLAGLPILWVLGMRGPVSCLRQICYGAGMISGALGLRYREYRKTHGS